MNSKLNKYKEFYKLRKKILGEKDVLSEFSAEIDELILGIHLIKYRDSKRRVKSGWIKQNDPLNERVTVAPFGDEFYTVLVEYRNLIFLKKK